VKHYMKKILIAMLLVLAMAIPAFAGSGGHVTVSSTAGVTSGNFGKGASFESACNSSKAGYDASTTNTSWSVKIFGITYSHSTTDVDASTYAGTSGGTFGNGIGFQSGFASATYTK